MAIFAYGQQLKSLIYLYKGCGDIVLGEAFLERIKPLLQLRFHGYVLVPVPSYIARVQERGFDHVPLLFSGIGREVVPAIEKTADVKQSDQSKKERRHIGRYFRLRHGEKLRGRKVLLVDDVYTTGSSVRACLRLLRKARPKKMAVLVLARVGLTGKKAR